MILKIQVTFMTLLSYFFLLFSLNFSIYFLPAVRLGECKFIYKMDKHIIFTWRGEEDDAAAAAVAFYLFEVIIRDMN